MGYGFWSEVLALLKGVLIYLHLSGVALKGVLSRYCYDSRIKSFFSDEISTALFCVILLCRQMKQGVLIYYGVLICLCCTVHESQNQF